MGDPLFVDGSTSPSSSSCSLKVIVVFVFLLVAVHAHGLVRAQGHLRHAEPDRPQPGRAVGDPPDARRRHQAVLQGGPAPRQGRPPGVPPGALPVDRPRLRLLRHRPHRRHDLDRRPRDLPPAGRPAHRRPVPAGHVVDRRLRRDAGRLVVGLEVPAARLGAGVGPDGVLRGGHGPGRGRRRARPPARSPPTTSSPPRTASSSWNICLARASCPSSSSSSPPPPRPTGRRSTWSRPSRSWSAASTPSTPRSASPCSSWPSS